jgi:hypothetical protein
MRKVSSTTNSRPADSISFIAKIAWERTRKQDKNYIIIICGGTGSGKSWLALRIAEEIQPKFNIENVVFSPEDFFQRLNKVKKGDVIIFDEAGVGIGARDHMRDINKDTNKILQTFRHENLILIMTVPGFGFIDIQARKLVHAYIEPKGIDYDKGLTYFKFNHLQYNPKYDKIYWHRQGVGGKAVNMHTIGRANNELIEEYVEKSESFKTELRRKINSAYAKRDQLGIIGKKIKAMKISYDEKVALWKKETGFSERSYKRYSK